MITSKAEKELIAAATALGRPFSPTEIGMALGYIQNHASSRVATRLRELTERKVLLKTGTGRQTRYCLVQSA